MLQDIKKRRENILHINGDMHEETLFMQAHTKQIRLLLGDQLNRQHSWWQTVDPDTVYVMMEVRQETDYVRHHIQKVVAFFAAMRAFAAELRTAGHRVHYLAIDDPQNQHSIPQNLRWLIDHYGARAWGYQLPDEYRLDQQLSQFAHSCDLPCEAVDTAHFLTTRDEMAAFFAGKKQLIMESFYRHLRKKHQILLDAAGKPEGGKWNYDAGNRKKWKGQPPVPPSPAISHDVRAIQQALVRAEAATFGAIDPQVFPWPIDRAESLLLLDHFAKNLLPHFGDFQDAMSAREQTLFHSRLSFSMNTKMLAPREVIDRIIGEWESRKNEIDIAQVEGFVRQILGWREYVRGIYWRHMPEYETLNYFEHHRPLPRWYWTGETRMNCLSHAIRQSLDTAYAHHIQRLMVTGNFALLAGIAPGEVDAWYLGIYIDAIQWVELPNTRGMSQFADGGIMATKPYVSSANYLHNMGDYCGSCHYDRNQKTGENACPFNALYWHFLLRNEALLRSNIRMAMPYRLLGNMDAETRRQLHEKGEHLLANLETL